MQVDPYTVHLYVYQVLFDAASAGTTSAMGGALNISMLIVEFGQWETA